MGVRRRRGGGERDGPLRTQLEQGRFLGGVRREEGAGREIPVTLELAVSAGLAINGLAGTLCWGTRVGVAGGRGGPRAHGGGSGGAGLFRAGRGRGGGLGVGGVVWHDDGRPSGSSPDHGWRLFIYLFQTLTILTCWYSRDEPGPAGTWLAARIVLVRRRWHRSTRRMTNPRSAPCPAHTTPGPRRK